MRPLLPVGRPGFVLRPDAVAHARFVAALLREYPRLTEEEIDNLSMFDAFVLIEHVPGLLPPRAAPSLEDELDAEVEASAEAYRARQEEAAYA